MIYVLNGITYIKFIKRLKLVALASMLFTNVGCNSLDRLINGKDVPKNTETETWHSRPTPDLTNAPDFGIPLPEGYNRRTVYHNVTPYGGNVALNNVTTDDVYHVFIRDAAGWFKLKPFQSGAYWYAYNATNATITYFPERAYGLEYCIYQDGR